MDVCRRLIENATKKNIKITMSRGQSMENEAKVGIESIARINEGKVLGTKDQSEQRLLEFCFEDELNLQSIQRMFRIVLIKNCCSY